MTAHDPMLTVERLFELIRQVVVDRQTQEWRNHAACRGVGPETFFVARGDVETMTEALGYCARCPVTDECREDAASHRTRFGIWGGEGATRIRDATVGHPVALMACAVCGADFEPVNTQTVCSQDCLRRRAARNRVAKMTDGYEVAS